MQIVNIDGALNDLVSELIGPDLRNARNFIRTFNLWV